MRLMLLSLMAGLVMSTAVPAFAMVRFGHGVLIGGHDFSNRTYGPNRRAVIHLYGQTPRHQGCRWHPDDRGGRVEVCHLRQL